MRFYIVAFVLALTACGGGDDFDDEPREHLPSTISVPVAPPMPPASAPNPTTKE